MKKVVRVGKVANNTLKDIFQLSFQDELERMKRLNMDIIKYQSLSDKEIEKLAIKIDLLPSEYSSILLLKYCFNSTPSETDKILEIKDSVAKLRYIKEMLSNIIGLNGSWIDDKSLERACQIALMEYTKDYNNTKILQIPSYTKEFRLKLKSIKVEEGRNRIFKLLAKRAAIFILVALLSFSILLVVKAEAREKVFDWIIETFPQFSIFTSQNKYEKSPLELTSLKINYIPPGFELVDSNIGREKLIYNYSTKNDQNLTILFSLSKESKTYYDTESSEIEEFTFKGFGAYIWQTSEITYLIWYQDGLECHISGNLDKNEILKIAENIIK